MKSVRVEMQLSGAIRLGAMLKPQAYGSMWRSEVLSSPGDVLGLRFVVASCAWGAAYDAAGLKESDPTPPAWAVLARAPAECPIPHCCTVPLGAGAVGAIIMHLNDWHRWTRERIADWVETIEAQQAAALRGDREAEALAVGCVETE